MIRLLVVDDQDIFRQDLATLLSASADLDVVGQASHGREAIALTQHLQPDVILMDVRMPVYDGVTATREIIQRYPWIRILVLTTFDDDEYVWQSLQAGALGYLLKHTPIEQIVTAIRSVYLGYCQLGPTIVPKVVAQLKPNPSRPKDDYYYLLSQRELEILKLMGRGKNNREIAQELHLSEGTVRNYVSQIFSQLDVRDRVQAVLWVQQHLLD
ncbi:response regulator transcription factor [Scytonema tolypothrichoides VB-61278]|nr:response regulator transcription factor [Scytonema tolypothrichoides VB-61278]